MIHSGLFKTRDKLQKQQFKGILISDNPNKKFKAIFDCNGKEKVIYFGEKNVEDFTTHLNPDLKQKFIAKHHCKDWADPMNESSLRRWILYNKCTLNASVNDYRKRFNL